MPEVGAPTRLADMPRLRPVKRGEDDGCAVLGRCGTLSGTSSNLDDIVDVVK